jgi:hypothetical protein
MCDNTHPLIVVAPSTNLPLGELLEKPGHAKKSHAEKFISKKK